MKSLIKESMQDRQNINISNFTRYTQRELAVCCILWCITVNYTTWVICTQLPYFWFYTLQWSFRHDFRVFLVVWNWRKWKLETKSPSECSDIICYDTWSTAGKPRVRMNGAITLLPYMPSWCGQRHIRRRERGRSELKKLLFFLRVREREPMLLYVIKSV